MSWADAGRGRKDRERLLCFQKDGTRAWASREVRYQKGNQRKAGEAVEEKGKGSGGRGKAGEDTQLQRVMVGCELWPQPAWFKHSSTASGLCNLGHPT